MAKVWRVKFDLVVSNNWIDDGFALKPQLLKEIVQDGILQYAYDSEKKVENIEITTLSRRKQRDG